MVLHIRAMLHRRLQVLSVLLLAGFAFTPAHAAVVVLGTQFQKDDWFPEFNCIWKDKYYPTSCPVGTTVGCNIHAYLKNTGASSVTISSVSLQGYDLATVLKLNTGVHNARSIYFYWDNPPQSILDAGEPVWYKIDPSATIPPGGVAQVVVRLRSVPVTNPVTLSLGTTAGTVNASIVADASAPQLASVGFSEDRKKVYLSWRRSGGAAPTSIYVDGVDVTASATTVGDPSVNYAATVISFPTALSPMSYHVYQGVYSDGKTATASLRTWFNKFIHSTYNTFDVESNPNYTIADWIAESSDHGINNCQVSVGNVVGYMFTPGGAADCTARGYGYTTGDKTKFDTRNLGPDMFFINDEIDAEETNMANTFCGTGLRLQCGKSPMGILAMRSIEEGEALRALRPLTPTSINMNGSFKPENYYSYGQAVDILQVDPYYQRRLQDAYWRDQYAIPVYTKATYIYAVSKAVARAAEPNPSNVILYSCSWKCTDTDACDAQYVNQVWPFADAETKRIEAYYALAAGTKGLCYWWLNWSGWPAHGLGDQSTQQARDLWKEIGLYGVEIKTLAPQLVTSHPVDMTLAPSTNVWARALASGTDTIILLAVNDDYYNDTAGFHHNVVNNASVVATLPSWMTSSPTAFEVRPSGLYNVATTLNGNLLTVPLGTLDITRMIVITTNPQLRAMVQQRYEEKVRPGVCNFAPEHCLPPQPLPASIAQEPSNLTVPIGDTATFTVVATGSSPITYQWQKNNADINNGGHYSGCTTATLTISPADNSDLGNYRCVATNIYGSDTSNSATLTLGTPVGPTITQHPSAVSVIPGGTAAFAVAATGTAPLSYHWQKNQIYLNNGGHYSGATTATLTIAGADSNDVANYRCVVTNGQGNATSNEAPLAVTSCSPGVLLNGNFEGGNTGGVGNSWVGYQRAPNPTTVWTIQTASPPSGGGLQYQQIANTSSTGGGGVRQDVTGCTIGVTYTISGWMRTNSLSSICTVKCSPSASTNWATAANLTPAQTTGSSSWVPFSGTITATGTSMTIWLDGQTGGTGLNKASCFDSVTVTANAAAPPAPTLSGTTPVCAGSTGNTATISNPAGGTYSWSISGGTITGNSNSSTVSYTAGPGPSLTLYATQTTCGSTSPQGSQPVTVNVSPAADFDGDCDVDAADAAHQIACTSGPLVPQTNPACQSADLDGDQDVDQDDFGKFQRCYSGQNSSANPNCAN